MFIMRKTHWQKNVYRIFCVFCFRHPRAFTTTTLKLVYHHIDTNVSENPDFYMEMAVCS